MINLVNHCSTTVYLTITCYCIVPHELLQFCRDKSCEPFGSHENNEDNFVDITDILSK